MDCQGLPMASSSKVGHQNTFFEFIVPGVLLNGVGLLGLVGNILSIIVLSRPQMKSSINCILIGLASFDTVLILTSILMFGLPAVHTYTQQWFGYYFCHIFPYITPWVYPVGMIAQTGSVYLTICVTIERYVAVCLPLKARYLCTFGRAKIYVAGVGFGAVLYNLPRIWEVTWEIQFIPELEANVTIVKPTELRQHATYIRVYITWCYLVVMYIVPFSCLALFNLLIYREVRRANTERANLTRLQKKEIGLATMLMVVVVVFFLCNILALVVNILEVMDINVIALNNTSNLLVTLNSSVNLVIYCIFGDKFKRIFCHIFCPSCLQQAGAASATDAANGQFLTRYPPLPPTTNTPKLLHPALTRLRQPLMANGERHRDRVEGIEDTYNEPEDLLNETASSAITINTELAIHQQRGHDYCISPRLEIQPIQCQKKKRSPMLEWLMDNLLRCKQDEEEAKKQNGNRSNSLPMQSRPYQYDLALANSSSSREERRRKENSTSDTTDNNKISPRDIRTVTVIRHGSPNPEEHDALPSPVMTKDDRF